MSQLSMQIKLPESLRGLLDEERDALTISSIRDDNQQVHILSRYGDAIWDLSPLVWPKNVKKNAKVLRFRNLHKPALLQAFKAALYARWYIVPEGYLPLSPNSMRRLFVELSAFFCWLDDQGVESLSKVTPTDCLVYATFCREQPGRKGKMGSNSVAHRLMAVETLWTVRDLMDEGLNEHPWPDESAVSLAAARRSGNIGVTEAIPMDVCIGMFMEAEKRLNEFERLTEILSSLEAIRSSTENEGYGISVYVRRASKYLVRNGFSGLRTLNVKLLEIRDACYFLVGITTGMRDHELASLKVGAYYESGNDGERYGWVKGHSSKTHAGDVEWLIPIEIGKKAIRIMESISYPFRVELDAKISSLEQELNCLAQQDPKRAGILVEIYNCRLHSGNLFLGKHANSGDIRTLSGGGACKRMKAFARSLGFDWNIHPHQFRTSFAVFVAGSRFGDLRYLKKHYKHWTMDMTLLYSLNRKQDEELYESVYDAANDYNKKVVGHWLDPTTKLSGGAAEQIKNFRRGAIKTFKSRSQMVSTLSEQILIRASGHGWCMADLDGCGGLGLIDKDNCVYCSNSVIDDSHTQIWTNIYKQQCELLNCEDIGPGGRERVKRDLRAAEKVLKDLNVSFQTVLGNDYE